jgi:hypothetical protein
MMPPQVEMKLVEVKTSVRLVKMKLSSLKNIENDE